MKPKPVPTLDEMREFLGRQISATKDPARRDYLLDQWNRLPELRDWLIQMGARGA